MGKISINGDTLIFSPEENILSNNIVDIKNDLDENAGSAKKVIFDLSEVNIIDSSGLGMLIAYQTELKRRNAFLTLGNPSEEISTMLHLMRLDKHFIFEEN